MDLSSVCKTARLIHNVQVRISLFDCFLHCGEFQVVDGIPYCGCAATTNFVCMPKLKVKVSRGAKAS